MSSDSPAPEHKQPEHDQPEYKASILEHVIEAIIFASRWLLVPIYLGLIGVLGVITFSFFGTIVHEFPHFATMTESEILLFALSLVDLSLVANLVLIIVFSGYENFVSRIETAVHKDRPSWMGKLDFAGLKIKLATSIVAISGIHLLRIFLNLKEYTSEQLLWYTVIHIAFVISGICFALMDWIHSKTSANQHDDLKGQGTGPGNPSGGAPMRAAGKHH